ncbi:hypothetical protein RIVM261_058740 [Rivularia sp. IAM M-261]|nr:hypothetical protein RIVM261_058740 [Rivularia sp. IAM M-261]
MVNGLKVGNTLPHYLTYVSGAHFKGAMTEIKAVFKDCMKVWLKFSIKTVKKRTLMIYLF